MFITEFTEYLLLEKKYAEHTVTAYRADLLSFVKFYEKEYLVKDVSTSNYSQIRSWIVELVNSGVSNRTINRKISSLKTYYKFLLKSEQITKNPLAMHQALKVSKKVQIPFSGVEVANVLGVELSWLILKLVILIMQINRLRLRGNVIRIGISP